MEFGPILRAMTRNKIGVLLLVVEIGFTLAIAINCLAVILVQMGRIKRETGLDEKNIMVVSMRPFSQAYRDDAFRNQLIDRDLARLRAMPGVVDASAMGPVPLQGGGSSGQAKPLGAPDSSLVRTPVYGGDDHMLNTLGLELVAGRAHLPEDMPQAPGPRPTNVIVTQDLADALFPNGDALGKALDTGSPDFPDTIVGIVKQMFTPYGGSAMESRIIFFPSRSGAASSLTYLVRSEPGSFNETFTAVPDVLSGHNADRIIQVASLRSFKRGGLVIEKLLVNIMGLIIGLLVFVTGLGILGMTSFAVVKRTKQIGVRRALGATKRDIVRYFLLENTMISCAGMILGLGSAYLLNLVLVAQIGAKPLTGSMLIGGVLFFWLVGLGAALAPALRAAAIEPATAAQTV